MQKQVIVPLANGVEELEAIGIIDILRRADLTVISAGIGRKKIVASRGTVIMADILWENVLGKIFDAIVLPGGYNGTINLMKTTSVISFLKKHFEQGSLIAAICAAPLVLDKCGITARQNITCHPGVASNLTASQYVNKRIVRNGKIITAQGPGVVFEFALTIVNILRGKQIAQKISREMIIK